MMTMSLCTVQGKDGGRRLGEKIIRVEKVIKLRGSVFGWAAQGGAGEVMGQSVLMGLCMCVRHGRPASPGSTVVQQL